MTTYEVDIPQSRDKGDGLAGWIGRKVRGPIRAMQYARLLQAMCELSDEQLAMIGLSRGDLPAHAHRCVYGDDL